MEALTSYSLKQLKNIVVAHNASEKVNIIKKYGLMKKAELIKAIQENIKEEHLSKILSALKLSSVPIGETMKIKVKKQPNKMETKMVEEMLMIMEDYGSKAAEKIRKSGMVDEMTAKQEEKIVEDFMKMMEMGGEKATEKAMKTKETKRQQTPPKSAQKKDEIENIFTKQKTSFEDFAYEINRIDSVMERIDGFEDNFIVPKKIKKVFKEASQFIRKMTRYINNIGEKNGLLDVNKMMEDIDEDLQSEGYRYYRQVLDPTGFDLEVDDDGETATLYIEASDMTRRLSQFGRESETKTVTQILDKYERYEFADVNIASVFSQLEKF